MIDLKELMEARSAHPPVPGELRYVQVRRRIGARRRRRVAVFVTAVGVAAALIGGYIAVPRTTPAPTMTAAPTPAPTATNGFPLNNSGFKVVASQAVPVSAGKMELTWTPSGFDFMLWTRCPAAPFGWEYRIRVDYPGGRAAFEMMPCGQPTTLTTARVGAPLTLSFTVQLAKQGTGIRQPSLAPLPEEGTFAAAVGEPANALGPAPER